MLCHLVNGLGMKFLGIKGLLTVFEGVCDCVFKSPSRLAPVFSDREVPQRAVSGPPVLSDCKVPQRTLSMARLVNFA